MSSTRRLVMFNRVTVDGCFASRDGALDFVVPDAELDESIAAGISTGERAAVLFGRKTYEMFAGFWPQVLAQGGRAAGPHGEGQDSGVMLAMAKWLDAAEKVVFSTTLQHATWRNTRIARSIDPAEIDAMKRQPGEGIMIFGSGSVVSQLTRHRLIDEYWFVVTPIVLGEGQALFRDVPVRTPLALLECKAYGTGNVMLRYAPGE